jgi:metal-responsive CopG/Arc/MetJ family transcriptional regulator
MSEEETGKRPVGRPPQEPSTVINLRIPNSLLERFNRYLDAEARWESDKGTNRSTVMRNLLREFLDQEEF